MYMRQYPFVSAKYIPMSQERASHFLSKFSNRHKIFRYSFRLVHLPFLLLIL